jgi:hypothetical protein
MHPRQLLCPDGSCVIPARADALFGLGIVTGITPANGTQPDKHRRLFRSSALFDFDLTSYGRSSGFQADLQQVARARRGGGCAF